MNAMSVSRLALAAFAAAFALSASAQTLYKLIDKNGKVTYSEAAPKNFDGQVIKIEIDPNANTATLPKPAPATANTETGRQRPQRESNPAKDDSEARIAQARDRLEGAKRALQEARDNPGEDDQMLVGKKGGGARTIPSEAYVQRLERLEQSVKNAEDELRRAERGI